MNIFKDGNKKYLKAFLVIVVAYIFIKLIDNSTSVLNAFGNIYKVLFPFVLAFIIAYILSPAVNFFNKKLKISRGLSIALTYVVFIATISIGAFFLFPKLYVSMMELINAIPSLTVEFQDKLSIILSNVEKTTNVSPINMLDIDINTIIERFSSVFTSLFNAILNTAISFTTYLVNIIFGFLISIYVLCDKDNFLSFGKRFFLTTLGRKNGEHLIKFVKILNSKVGTYIAIKAFDSLIIGLLAFIGLSVISSKYILLLAVIVGVTNMIPYFGPFIGMIVAFFVNLFAADFKLAIISLIFLFLLQQFDAWYLDPKLIGNKVGLSPFLVVFAVTIGAFIYGPVGMILASPIASVIKIYTIKLLNKYDYRRTGKKKEKEIQTEKEEEKIS